jgi:ubiquinone/menaquinone biosynthesis C-methylase UbiE
MVRAEDNVNSLCSVGQVAQNTVSIRSSKDIAITLEERRAAENGFLSKPLQLLSIAVGIVGGYLYPPLVLAASTLLLVDFIFFVTRRRLIMARWDIGKPRLEKPEDLARADEAFEKAGVPSPTMSDFEQAAGLGDTPQWKTDLRYQRILQFYDGGTVADIGCGEGRLCWKYKICDPRKYYGIDCGGLIRMLHEKTGGANAIDGVAESTGLPSASMDLVVCSEVFEHLPRPEIALREFARIVKPGGRIIIQSPSATCLRNFNPFHGVVAVIGRWVPSILQRKVVHAHTFLRAFTYHWDFTVQDFKGYLQGLPLSMQLFQGSTYHFNPAGSFVHRVLYRVAHWPFIHWFGWDLTVVLERI